MIELHNGNCLHILKDIPDNKVNLTLTDIPYGECNRNDNGLRNLDKEGADVETFNLQEFLNDVYRVTNGTIIVFCGQHQFSEIKNFFQDKQDKGKGTVRQLIWEKTNPSPMNGQHIYLSGIENAVWFKKSGGTFNARCKNTVFRYPCGKSKLHPTEKNHDLLKELILDNSNKGDLVLDPCMGSGSTGVACIDTNREFIGIELNEHYFNISKERLEQSKSSVDLW